MKFNHPRGVAAMQSRSRGFSKSPESNENELFLAARADELRQVLAILQSGQDGQNPGRRAAQPAAVDIRFFCEARLENSLRCLVCRGYVKQRLPRGRRRISSPPVPTCGGLEFPPWSRFSITSSGRTIARQLDQLLGKLGPAAPAASAGRIVPAAQPRFDAGPRALSFGDRVLRRFRRSAHNQLAILVAFQRANWPPRIANPLPHAKPTDPGERLRAAIHGLNGGQRPRAIRFFSDGTGDGICWELETFSAVETFMILDLLSRDPSATAV